MGFEQVTGASAIATLYTPFSDSLTRCFVNSKSFLGPYLVHNVHSVLKAGVMGFTISSISERVYQYVKNNFYSEKYHKNTVVALGTRYVLHIGVGGILGAVGSHVLGITVANGVALGSAAFIGPQLIRVIYKVCAYLVGKIPFQTIKPYILNVINKFDESRNNRTEVNIYESLGLDLAAQVAGTKYQQLDKTQYNADSFITWINADLTRIFDGSINSLKTLYQPLGKWEYEVKKQAARRLFNGIAAIGSVILEYKAKHDCNFCDDAYMFNTLTYVAASALIHKTNMETSDVVEGSELFHPYFRSNIRYSRVF